MSSTQNLSQHSYTVGLSQLLLLPDLSLVVCLLIPLVKVALGLGQEWGPVRLWGQVRL